MSCGLPHDKLDESITSVKKLLKLAIDNESFPEAKLEKIWRVYQELKEIKVSLNHSPDITFVPDDRFADVISFTTDT